MELTLIRKVLLSDKMKTEALEKMEINADLFADNCILI